MATPNHAIVFHHHGIFVVRIVDAKSAKSALQVRDTRKYFLYPTGMKPRAVGGLALRTRVTTRPIAQLGNVPDRQSVTLLI
jgi:hypothetical protein